MLDRVARKNCIQTIDFKKFQQPHLFEYKWLFKRRRILYCLSGSIKIGRNITVLEHGTIYEQASHPRREAGKLGFTDGEWYILYPPPDSTEINKLIWLVSWTGAQPRVPATGIGLSPLQGQSPSLTTVQTNKEKIK